MYNKCKLMTYDPGPPLIEGQYGYTYVVEVEYKTTTLFYGGYHKYKGLCDYKYNTSSQVPDIIRILINNPSKMTILERFTDKRSILKAESELIKSLQEKYGIFHHDSGRCINYNTGSGSGIYYLNEDDKKAANDKRIATLRRKYNEDPNSVPQWNDKKTWVGEKNPFYGKHHTKEMIDHLNELRSVNNIGRIWIHNGNKEKFIHPNDQYEYLNDGWELGRSKFTKDKISLNTTSAMNKVVKPRTRYDYKDPNGNIHHNQCPNVVAVFHKDWIKIDTSSTTTA